MGLSGAAITYLVGRFTDSGYVVRQADPTDRRKVIVRSCDHGMRIARAFSTRVDEYTRRAYEGFPHADRQAAHRTFAALMGGMRAFRSYLHPARKQRRSTEPTTTGGGSGSGTE